MGHPDDVTSNSPSDEIIRPPMADGLMISLNPDDVLFIGAVQVSVHKVGRNRAEVRVKAPDTPIVLLSQGRVKIGAHHRLADMLDPSRAEDT